MQRALPFPHPIISTSSSVLTANMANQAEKPKDYWFLSNKGSERISHYQSEREESKDRHGGEGGMKIDSSVNII